MQLRDKLHYSVTGAFVDEPSHGRVFQVLQLVAEVNRVDHTWVTDRHCLLKAHFLAKEFPKIGLLGQEKIVLVGLIVVVVIAVGAGRAVRR